MARLVTDGNLVHDTSTTSRLAEDSHSVRVTTKEVNILLNPLEGHSLIQKSSIGSTVLLEGRTTEPPKGTKSVVHGDIDDTRRIVVLASCEKSCRVTRAGFVTRRISTTIEPNFVRTGAIAEREQGTYQTRTGAPYPLSLASKMASGTTTSRKRQSSVVLGLTRVNTRWNEL